MRGDIVFWKGHVGIMVDAYLLLHANAHHMGVVVEPLGSAVDRIARAGLKVSRSSGWRPRAPSRGSCLRCPVRHLP